MKQTILNLCIMRTGKKVDNKTGNKGYSLVELIVVISIMAVMVGVLAFGIGMMFTRDSNYVAVRIDDELTEARTLAMSREGVFTYVLHADNDPSGDHKDGFVRIDQTITVTEEDDSETETTEEYRKVPLDKSVTISVTGASFDADGNMTIIFDKANGSVKSVNGSPPAAGALYTFTVTSARNASKKSEVTLAATTGRHYTEK